MRKKIISIIKPYPLQRIEIRANNKAYLIHRNLRIRFTTRSPIYEAIQENKAFIEITDTKIIIEDKLNNRKWKFTIKDNYPMHNGKKMGKNLYFDYEWKANKGFTITKFMYSNEEKKLHELITNYQVNPYDRGSSLIRPAFTKIYNLVTTINPLLTKNEAWQNIALLLENQSLIHYFETERSDTEIFETLIRFYSESRNNFEKYIAYRIACKSDLVNALSQKNKTAQNILNELIPNLENKFGPTLLDDLFTYLNKDANKKILELQTHALSEKEFSYMLLYQKRMIWEENPRLSSDKHKTILACTRELDLLSLTHYFRKNPRGNRQAHLVFKNFLLNERKETFKNKILQAFASHTTEIMELSSNRNTEESQKFIERIIPAQIRDYGPFFIKELFNVTPIMFINLLSSLFEPSKKRPHSEAIKQQQERMLEQQLSHRSKKYRTSPPLAHKLKAKQGILNVMGRLKELQPLNEKPLQELAQSFAMDASLEPIVHFLETPRTEDEIVKAFILFRCTQGIGLLQSHIKIQLLNSITRLAGPNINKETAITLTKETLKNILNTFGLSLLSHIFSDYGKNDDEIIINLLIELSRDWHIYNQLEWVNLNPIFDNTWNWKLEIVDNNRLNAIHNSFIRSFLITNKNESERACIFKLFISKNQIFYKKGLRYLLLNKLPNIDTSTLAKFTASIQHIFPSLFKTFDSQLLYTLFNIPPGVSIEALLQKIKESAETNDIKYQRFGEQILFGLEQLSKREETESVETKFNNIVHRFKKAPRLSIKKDAKRRIIETLDQFKAFEKETGVSQTKYVNKLTTKIGLTPLRYYLKQERSEDEIIKAFVLFQCPAGRKMLKVYITTLIYNNLDYIFEVSSKKAKTNRITNVLEHIFKSFGLTVINELYNIGQELREQDLIKIANDVNKKKTLYKLLNWDKVGKIFDSRWNWSLETRNHLRIHAADSKYIQDYYKRNRLKAERTIIDRLFISRVNNNYRMGLLQNIFEAKKEDNSPEIFEFSEQSPVACEDYLIEKFPYFFKKFDHTLLFALFPKKQAERFPAYIQRLYKITLEDELDYGAYSNFLMVKVEKNEQEIIDRLLDLVLHQK